MALALDSKPPIPGLPPHLKAMFMTFTLQSTESFSTGSHPQAIKNEKELNRQKNAIVEVRGACNNIEDAAVVSTGNTSIGLINFVPHFENTKL